MSKKNFQSKNFGGDKFFSEKRIVPKKIFSPEKNAVLKKVQPSKDNPIFVSKVSTPSISLLLGLEPGRFWWGVLVLVVLVVVVVTGVKQSQLLDFKSWSRSGV